MSCPGCGSDWHAPGRLREAVRAAERDEDTVAFLPTHVLTALHQWNDGRSPALAAELERRTG